MSRIASLLAILLLAFLAVEARAACNCATSEGNGAGTYCTGNSVTYTSTVGQERTEPTSMTITFGDPDGAGAEDDQYTCGQYANGEYWVLGKSDGGGNTVVRVLSKTPAWDGTKHGHQANVNAENASSFDDQGGRYGGFSGAPQSFPHSYDVTGANSPIIFSSIISRDHTGDSQSHTECNDASGDGQHRSCHKFVAHTGFVNAIPDSDGDDYTSDEFRPGYAGTAAEKNGPFRVDMMNSRMSGFPRLDATQITVTKPNVTMVRESAESSDLSHIHVSEQYVYGWVYDSNRECYTAGGNAGSGSRHAYGTNVRVSTAGCILRLMLDDITAWDATETDIASRNDLTRAAIGIVQKGLDFYSVNTDVGAYWGPTEDPSPSGADYSGINTGYENWGWFAAWALNQTALNTWFADSNPYFSNGEWNVASDGVSYIGYTAAQHFICGLRLAPMCRAQSPLYPQFADPSCAGEQCYGDRNSNAAAVVWLMVNLVTGGATTWDDDNWLDSVYSWREGGRPGATGHTQYRWTQNASSCRNTRCVTSYQSTFGDAMYAAFRDTALGTPPGYSITLSTSPSPAQGDVTLNVTPTGTANNLSAGEDVDWERDCTYDGATFVAEEAAVTTTEPDVDHTFSACAYATAGEYVLAVRGTRDPGGADEVDLKTTPVTATDPAAAPAVEKAVLINCDTPAAIETVFASGQTMLANLTELDNPACLGIGIIGDANVASVGYDYTPAPGETESTPYEGELNAPFAFLGDSGWHLEDEVAACHCTQSGRGDLTVAGTHVLTVTPCSVDPGGGWTAGDKASQCTTAGGTAGTAFAVTVETTEVLAQRNPGMPLTGMEFD